MNRTLEFAVHVPSDLAEEFEKKLAFVVEGLKAVAYDARDGRVRLELPEGSSPTRQLVEARVREIAEKLSSTFQPGFRRTLSRRERPTSLSRPDPHPILLREGELKEFGHGRMGLGPKLVALLQALDALILNRFARFEARAHQFPSLISAEVLDRCRYLRNFPATLTLVTHLREDLSILQRFASQVRWERDRLEVPPDALGPFSVLLAPAVCFHWYHWLARRRLARAAVDHGQGEVLQVRVVELGGLERLWDFTMREIIFVGPPDFVLDRRQACVDRAIRLLDDLGLKFTVATATDPFFVDSYAVQAAFQQGFELKYELLCLLPYTGQAPGCRIGQLPPGLLRPQLRHHGLGRAGSHRLHRLRPRAARARGGRTARNRAHRSGPGAAKHLSSDMTEEGAVDSTGSSR